MSLSLALILNKSTRNATFSKAQLKSHWQQIFVIFLFHFTKLFYLLGALIQPRMNISGYMSIVLFWLPWLSSCSKQCRSAALFQRQDGGSREGVRELPRPLRQRQLHLRSDQQPLAPGTPWGSVTARDSPLGTGKASSHHSRDASKQDTAVIQADMC